MTEKIRIMVVEDHQATLEGLSGALGREEGFEIVGMSENSDDALKLADQVRPNVIVLDLHLPGSLGPKEMVDEFVRVPDTKVVIFSAESRIAFIEAVLAQGVAAYLLKSERLSTVADTVRRVVRGEKNIVSQALTFDHKKLTPSEQEVLHMLGRGMKYQEIADERLTSAATARKQCEVLQLKLNLENREQLIAWAVQNGYGSRELGN
ncbi:MAG: response regulator transcription factor [Leptolyngbya sp.]|nr:response regulator transcription factor [Candidatus Melainabacteria bacterium]